MKYLSLILLLAFSFTGSWVCAQDFYISPNPVYKNDITAADVEEVAYADIFNVSGSEITLTWERIVIDMTEGWESAVCDVVMCYLPFVSSKEFDLGNNASGDMDVHVYPNGVEGHAIIEIKVFETDNPSNAISGMYYFNQTVGVTEKFTEAIKIYPNPTHDYILIDNLENLVAQVEVYSVAGQLVLNSALSGNDKVNVQDLPAGNYIVKLSDQNSKIVSTNLLVKQ